MLTGSEMQLVVTISDYVAIKKILIWWNKKGKVQKQLPFPEQHFRLRRLFGNRKSPDLNNKESLSGFSLLVSIQNELCQATFVIKADAFTMLNLCSFTRNSFWRHMRPTIPKVCAHRP